MPSPPVMTQRLRMRPWTDADLPAAHALWGDRAVTALISAAPIDPAARLADEQAHLAEHGVQYWLAQTHDGIPIGCAGLHVRPTPPRYELGFHILPAHQRQGHAREAARGVLTHAFTALGAPSVFAGHHPANTASESLLTSLGFNPTAPELFGATGLLHPSYVLDRPAAVGALDVYELIAEQYQERLGDELEGKPFDRRWLAELAQRTPGPLCDLGCGPGHVTRFLSDAGAAPVGRDLSPAMVRRARATHPDLPFEVGSMDALSDPDDTWDAVLLMYAIVNRPTASLPPVFAELARAVRPGGELALSFHTGDEVLAVREWWGHDVLVDFVFHDTDAVVDALHSTGWSLVDRHVRDSYGLPIEYPSRRAYLRARNAP